MATNEFTRMSPELYAKFEQLLPKPLLDPDKPNGAHYIGYQLGVQHVLRLLRDGFVTR